MLNKFKKIFGTSLIVFVMLFSFSIVYSSFVSVNIVYATNGDGGGPNGDEDVEDQEENPVDDILENPLGTIETIPEFIKVILRIVMIIGVPIIALAIIYTGFLFIKAQGKPDKLKEAKDAFVYVLIGAAILLASLVIAKAIEGTVNKIRGTQSSMIENIDDIHIT